MKTKLKNSICFFVFLLVMVFSACGTITEYEFMHKSDEMASVTIVELVDYDTETSQFKEKELAKIDEIDKFITALKAIPCTGRAIPPNYLVVGKIVVKITYKNGDFELIHPDAQSRFDVDEGVNGISDEYEQFDEDAFIALIAAQGVGPLPSAGRF